MAPPVPEILAEWRNIMLTLRKSAGLALLAAGALAVAGCGGSDDSNALLTVKLTDNPVDNASEVVVVFTGIEFQPTGREPFSVDFCEEGQAVDECAKYINLLDFQDGATVTLLDEYELQAGQYNWIRLKVLAEQNNSDGSYIVFEEGGEKYPLWIPSGSQTGLKIQKPFIVSQQGNNEIVIDFDLRKSVLAPPGLDPNYILKPVLRLVDNLLVGRISGAVELPYLAETQEAEACSGGVYVFEGMGVIPDDMDAEGGVDLLVYKPLLPLEIDGTLAFYTVPFLEEGEYTVAFTCDYAVDDSAEDSEYDPDAAEDEDGFGTMRWTVFGDVYVEADATTRLDYLRPEAE
jgi:hypothetical protein